MNLKNLTKNVGLLALYGGITVGAVKGIEKLDNYVGPKSEMSITLDREPTMTSIPGPQGNISAYNAFFTGEDGTSYHVVIPAKKAECINLITAFAEGRHTGRVTVSDNQIGLRNTRVCSHVEEERADLGNIESLVLN